LAAEGAIKEHTHLVLDKKTGNVIERYGANRFYMPHGLSVDSFDNVWVTDVALHQVFKMEPGKDEPSLTIGEAFVPGSDNHHFCKPTSVAVAKSGEFYVADGYCNSRIVKYSPEGKYILEFGKSSNGVYPPPAGTFSVPHSVTLVEDWNLLCVADRENERIQCFSAGLRHDPRALPAGTFIKKADGLGRVYAIDNLNHYLVGVTNSGLTNARRQLFVVDLESGESRVSEPGLENPHDLAAAEDGTIYVAEIGPNRIVRVHL
jgi:peptidylamidoglycolate lyase